MSNQIICLLCGNPVVYKAKTTMLYRKSLGESVTVHSDCDPLAQQEKRISCWRHWLIRWLRASA